MYYTNVSIGTPPTMFTVIVDTGSGDLLIPNASCQTCAGDPSTFYDVSESQTGEIVHCNDARFSCSYCALPERQCVFDTGYVGITETSALATDVATILGTPTPIAATFGAILNISMPNQMGRRRGIAQDDFYPDGMWGMGRQALSSSGALPFMDAIVQGTGVADIFSHCLASSGQGGLLTIGGVSPHLKGEVQYTPFVADDFYSVNMTDLLIGGKSIGLDPSIFNTQHCIVDSGTPTPTLPVKVFGMIAKALVGTCRGPSPLKGICDAPQGQSLLDGKCANLTSADIGAYPTLTFVLSGGLKLDYPPQAYLRETFKSLDLAQADSDSNFRNMFFCDSPSSVALAFSSDPSGFGTVLGMTLLQRFVTVYDRRQSRMGFGGVANCPEPN